MYVGIFCAINAIYRPAVALAADYFTLCLLILLCVLYGLLGIHMHILYMYNIYTVEQVTLLLRSDGYKIFLLLFIAL